MLHADDLCLTANRPDQLQTMLNRFDEYAKRKRLTINTAKSEVVHFNSHGINVPAFSVGGAPLANKDSSKFLGMVFYRTHNIAKSTEHMLGPFMAGCHRIRQFAREHRLIDRPHALLWLAKCYAFPASMYACQIWGTWFMKKGSEFDSPLQTAHLCFLKSVLGVKRSTPNWAVLRECGQEPLQFRAGTVACSRRLCMQVLLKLLLTESAGLRSS